MGVLSTLQRWLGGKTSSQAIFTQVNDVADELTAGLKQYACIALVVSAGMADIAQAQPNEPSKPVTVPVIEAVEQPTVDSLYEQAKQINADQDFTPDDLPEQASHAEELVNEFDTVGDEIESLVEEGETEEARKLLDVLETSVQNVHYNLTRLLDSAKRSDGSESLIRMLEDLTRDLKSVQDSIDAERNLLASRHADAVEKLKASVDDDPLASIDEKEDKLILRITAESAKQSVARSKAVSRLDHHMAGKGLEGETHFDIDIPDGDEDIRVTTVTEIALE